MKARILVVEDSDAQRERLKEALERFGYEVDWASSGAEGLKRARLSPPDLVLLDVVMKDMDGFVVCRWLKLREETRDIPVIMLTVKTEIADRVEGLNVGADDYLPKPFDDIELEARIFAALRSKSKSEDLKRQNDELKTMLRSVEALAVTDGLTGLFNRRRFDEDLKREFKVSRRYKSALACVVLDVDNFKQVNDTAGHDAGDHVLREVSNILRATLREVDHLARFGGDEFAILMPQTDKAGAAIAAERIRELVVNHDMALPDGTEAITLSIGIADIDDFTESDPHQLIRSADTALFDAKRDGRNRVALFRSEEPR